MWLSRCRPGCRQVLWKKQLWEEMNQPGAPRGCGVLGLVMVRGELAEPPRCQPLSVVLALLITAFRCPQFSPCCGGVCFLKHRGMKWRLLEARRQVQSWQQPPKGPAPSL